MKSCSRSHTGSTFSKLTPWRAMSRLALFALFRIDDASNGILLFLHSRRRCVKSICGFHCVVAWHCWSRQRPSDAEMLVCVTFGAWWLWHDLCPFAACANRIGFVMDSGPLCLRTQVLLCDGAHAHEIGGGCLHVPRVAWWPVGVSAWLWALHLASRHAPTPLFSGLACLFAACVLASLFA